MKILKILIFFIALFLLAIVSIDKYSKFNQEKFRLKETLAGVTRDGRVLKKEYDRELKERLRLKNRYDLTKEEKETLQTEIVRQEALQAELVRKDKEQQALMAEVKELVKKNEGLRDELGSLKANHKKKLEDVTKQLGDATKQLENVTKEKEKMQGENLELQKEKQELQRKNLELEKKFKNLEWINPED